LHEYPLQKVAEISIVVVKMGKGYLICFGKGMVLPNSRLAERIKNPISVAKGKFSHRVSRSLLQGEED